MFRRCCVGFVQHHLQRSAHSIENRIVQKDSTLQKLDMDRIPTAELFPLCRICIKDNEVLNQ